MSKIERKRQDKRLRHMLRAQARLLDGTTIRKSKFPRAEILDKKGVPREFKSRFTRIPQRFKPYRDY